MVLFQRSYWKVFLGIIFSYLEFSKFCSWWNSSIVYLPFKWDNPNNYWKFNKNHLTTCLQRMSIKIEEYFLQSFITVYIEERSNDIIHVLKSSCFNELIKTNESYRYILLLQHDINKYVTTCRIWEKCMEGKKFMKPFWGLFEDLTFDIWHYQKFPYLAFIVISPFKSSQHYIY